MLDMETMLATTERYNKRAQARAAFRQRRDETGSILQANDRELVRERLEGVSLGSLVQESAGNLEIAAPSLAGVQGDLMIDALERIIGRNTLQPLWYLERGLQVSRAVARIAVDGPHGRGFGTGFMVSPRLLLTNNHVLQDEETARASRAELNYQERVDRTLEKVEVFELDPGTFFLTDLDLDFSLVAVKGGDALERYGYIPFSADSSALVGEWVSIIQHPAGRPKQISLRENEVLDLVDRYLHYHTATLQGSSGSPVFNNEWRLVALHHSGVPAKNDRGEILTIDNTVWSNTMGPDKIKWLANEGVLVSSIAARVKALDLSGQKSDLRGQLLAAKEIGGLQTPLLISLPKPMPPVDPQRPLPLQGPTLTPAHDGGGTAVWTIPLEVSVRVGAPVMTGGGAGFAPATQQRPAAPPARPRPEPLPPVSLKRAREDALRELREARLRPYYDAAADAQARDAYYASLPLEAGPEKLFQALSDLLERTHDPRPRYSPGRELYPWIDLQPNLKIQSIYSHQEFEPEKLIEDEFIMLEKLEDRAQELRAREATMDPETLRRELDLLEASAAYNCEHVVPQSWFGKQEPMRGDLHHLFACESRCNSFRGNTPYFDFEDVHEALMTDCGRREKTATAGGGFEPGNGKGTVARATLYFLLRYPRKIQTYDAERIRTFVEWAKASPPADYEKHRNQSIFARQHNRNPLVDMPELLNRLDFTLGLGA